MSGKFSKNILYRDSRMLKLHNKIIINLVSKQIEILDELEKAYTQLQFPQEINVNASDNNYEPNLKRYNIELLIFQLVIEFNCLETRIDNLRHINSMCQE